MMVVLYVDVPGLRLYNVTIPLGRSAKSTLFPYTTLFRSVGIYPDALTSLGLVGYWGPEEAGDNSANRYGVDAVLRRKVGGKVDRKSTRLNSSHDQNSYAVFCLKKKKKAEFLLVIQWRSMV